MLQKNLIWLLLLSFKNLWTLLLGEMKICAHRINYFFTLAQAPVYQIHFRQGQGEKGYHFFMESIRLFSFVLLIIFFTGSVTADHKKEKFDCILISCGWFWIRYSTILYTENKIPTEYGTNSETTFFVFIIIWLLNIF